MKLDEMRSDEAVLAALGERLARLRLDRGLTQAQLAEEAGVAKRTVERMEAGNSVQMVTLVRLCRVLGLMDGLDRLVPEPGPTPLALLRKEAGGKGRQRASGRRAARGRGPGAGGKGWTWGDES
jgi:transcriptional regulator with XRE-family HTH domain